MAIHTEPLGQAQLEVLQYVVDNHPIRVSDVAEHFAETAGKARTTILTVMERLREKGYLTRKKLHGTFHYSPKLAKTDLMTSLVRRFVDESLGGSLSPFIAFLADSREVSDEEIASLKQIVRDIEKSRRENSQ
jgi:predicted transcriptional regulator